VLWMIAFNPSAESSVVLSMRFMHGLIEFDQYSNVTNRAAMNLRQLEAFRATMRSGSITAAAKLMHISQPSVSRLISDLERSVGFALFVRAGRGLVTTVEARRFYQGVEGMFIGVDKLSELADTIRSTSSGTVSVGVIPSLSTIEMPSAVAQIYRAHKDVSIMVYVRNTPAIIDAVQMQQFDIGIVGRQPPYDGVETLYHTTVPYVCLIPEGHALDGGDGQIDLDQISQTETFITFGKTVPDGMLEMDPALAQKLRERSRLSAANMPVAAALVRETGAIAVVDFISAGIACGMGGVVSRPITQRLKYHIAIVTRGQDSLSMEARALTDVLIGRLDRLEKTQ
jgi:DNA-binding transcriptional LysR family regulator